MKTPYGKLAALTVLLMAGLMLFAPMRSGEEDMLTVSSSSVRMNMGDTYDIDYTLYSDHAQNVFYDSADETVAKVNQQGIITAIGAGQTQIHVMAQSGARAAVQVDVAGIPVTTLSLNTDQVNLEKGQISGLKAVFNSGATDTRVAWISSDENVAKVDAIGRVSAVGGGVSTITATTPGGLSASAQVSVHVSGTAVHITPAEVTVGTGTTLTLGTYYLPHDTTDEIDRWTSSDPSVLKVSKNGEMTAVNVGTAVLSVFTKEGLSGSTVIKVERAAEDFEVAPSAVTIERDQTYTLEPRFMDETGHVNTVYSEHYVSWNSSNPEVATVENGVVTGLKSGMTRITASADGMSANCIVTVEVLVHEVTLDQEEVYMLREETVNPIQLNTAIFPIDPDDPTIIYSTDNPQVANVSSDGLVIMTGAYGTATITAKAQSGAEDHFIVHVVTQLPAAEPTAEPIAEGDANSGIIQ